MTEIRPYFNTEAVNPPTISYKESVVLADKDKTTVCVETTKEQLADYIEEYANYFGLNGVEAKSFFENNVDFTFDVTEALAKYGNPNLSPIEVALNKALFRLGRVRPLGLVITQHDGRLTFCINMRDLAKRLPKAKENQTPSETFQDRVQTVTNHELRHILQHMAEPDMIRQKTKQDSVNQKLLIGLATATFVGGIVPETLPYALGGLAGLKCFTLFVYGKGIDTEKDPSETQKIDMSQLQRRPFNFNSNSSLS